MTRSASLLTAACAAIATSLACTSSSNAPLTPSVPSGTVSAGAVAAPLKATAPSPQSPVNDRLMGTLGPTTFTATTARADFANVALQYRFQLFNDVGAQVQDSGLLDNPTWTFTPTLTPLKRYTWRVRAEYQGSPTTWSAMASFTTPEQPSAYNRPIGNWQACASLVNGQRRESLVECVWNAVHPTDSVSAFELTKRVAWLLRGEGAGLLIKDSGENTVRWQGYSFSASRICYPDGTIIKLMSDVGPGGTNAPIWGAPDMADPMLYVPAIDPAKP